MALSDRVAHLVLAGITGVLAVAALATDLPRQSKGELWGDGATYHAMAWSLAEDFDLRYEARDLLRIRHEWGGGPQGVVLKRASGGLRLDVGGGFPWISRVPKEDPRLYYAESFVYPLVAAPFVKVFGTRGMLLANVLAFGLALWLGYGERRRRGNDPLRSLVLVLAVFFATVVPLYLLWPAPEVFGLALATAGLVATSAGRSLLAAVLLGVAVYLKPPNALLALPLGIAALLPGPGEPLFGALLLPRVREALKRTAVLVATALALYAANALVTGEANYLGGERKTFYARFPFEAEDATFDSAGFRMSTENLGASEGVRASLLRDLGYFCVGRFAGLLAYFAPAFCAVLVFVLLGPRTRRGWLALLCLVASALFYIRVIPDNWFGGPGTVGNRYFLALLPLTLFLVPRGRVWPVATVGLLMGVAFLWPVLASPLFHSLHPGSHATAGLFRFLPPELTMLDDLSVFTEPWRKKQPYGFTGDPLSPGPADADAYFLYFMDDGTRGKETVLGREGFRLRSGRRAEIVLRAFDIAPLQRLLLRLTAGPRGDEVDVRLGGATAAASLAPGQTTEVTLEADPGLRYHDTHLHVLQLRSRRPEGDEGGTFAEIRLKVGPPAR